MRIAISAQGDDIDSLVDPRFGRAAWLIFIDSESGSLAAMPNAENADASGARRHSGGGPGRRTER